MINPTIYKFIQEFTEVEVKQATHMMKTNESGIRHDVLVELFTKTSKLLNSDLSDIDKKKILIRLTPDEHKAITFNLSESDKAKFKAILSSNIKLDKPKKLFVDKGKEIAKASVKDFDDKFKELYAQKPDSNPDVAKKIQHYRRWVVVSNLPDADKVALLQKNYKLNINPPATPNTKEQLAVVSKQNPSPAAKPPLKALADAPLSTPKLIKTPIAQAAKIALPVESAKKEAASTKYPEKYQKLVPPYERIFNIKLEEKKGEYDSLQVQLPSELKKQLTRISYFVNDDIKSANDIRPMLKMKLKFDASLIQSAFCSIIDKEAHDRKPSYLLVENLTQTEKIYLNAVCKQVKMANPHISDEDVQTLSILFGIKRLKELIEKQKSEKPT
jgi:hypothetical protein